ncbi:hypothetical protein [Arthrobacter oryzae]|uniref:Uncharacterized protein n=1 Tax=Arthrobacter oryzae TaxID=409290 RepID=A0A495E7F7_9MICC|nr:hypothetical protein [Arthrobacter oryzae]RKR12726.1 hypothetical protein C8D78_3632 [Arthrobacter oryzae]
MPKIRRVIEVIFVLTLVALLIGGVLVVTGQAIALIAGQSAWLQFFNESVNPPLCIVASVCAIAGFLLSYKTHQKQRVKAPQEAATR